MDQKDDFNVQSHQETQYEHENKYVNINFYRKWEDKTSRPRVQSAQHSARQNFERRELQHSKATSPGPSYRRKKEQAWKYETFQEDNSKEDNDNVLNEEPPRSKQGKWNQHGNWNQQGRCDQPEKWNKHGKWNRAPGKDKQLRQTERLSSQHGYGPSDKRKRGDQGHIAFDDWKHGNRGFVPSDRWNIGDQGHAPSDKWKHGNQGRVPSDKWKPGDRGHLPASAWEYGDQGQVPSGKWKHEEQGLVPSDKWKPGDRGHVPTCVWEHGDQGVACADDQAWENCTPGVMEFLRSVRPCNIFSGESHENQSRGPCEKSGDKTNSTTNKVKAEELESQQGDEFKVDRNEFDCNTGKTETTGEAVKIIVDECFEMLGGDSHDKTNSTANKVKVGKLKSQRGNEFKDNKNEFDCNTGKTETTGEAGKIVVDECFEMLGGDSHDKTNSTTNKINTEELESQRGNEFKDNRNEFDCNTGKTETTGEAGKIIVDECFEMLGGDSHDKTNSTTNKINTEELESQRGNEFKDNRNEFDCNTGKTETTGEAGKIIVDECFEMLGGDSHDKTNSTTNKINTEELESQRGNEFKDNRNEFDCNTGKTETTGEAGKIIVDECFEMLGGDSHDKTNSTANKVKVGKLKSQRGNEFKDNKNEFDCNTGKTETTGEAGKIVVDECFEMLGGDSHDKTNSTTNKINTEELESQRGNEFKDNRNEFDCNTGKTETTGEAGKIIVDECFEMLGGDSHDKTNSTADKVKAEELKSQQGDELKNGRSESDCNTENNEASGEAGKAIGNENFAMTGHDNTNCTVSEVKTGKKKSQKAKGEDMKDDKNQSDCGIDKNEASGEADKMMGNESWTIFGHDKTDPATNKVKAGNKISQKVKDEECKDGKNKSDCNIGKNEASGEVGKTMGNESLARVVGDGHDKTDSAAKKVKAGQKKSLKVKDNELKDDKNNSDCNTGKNEASGEAGHARLAGDGHDKTNSTENKVKAGQKKSLKVKQGDDLKNDRNESLRNIGKNEASGEAGKAMNKEDLATCAAGDKDGYSARASTNSVRYAAGRERAETNDRVYEQRGNETGVQTGRRKAQRKLDDKSGIVFYKSSQFRNSASNREGRYTDDESSVYQNQGRSRENNYLKPVKADDGGCRRASKDGFKHAAEQERKERNIEVGWEIDSPSEIGIPTGKQKAGKSKTKRDGKTSNHEGSYKDGGPSANDKKIRVKERNNSKIVEVGESYDDRKDSMRTLINSSDISGKRVQCSAREAERRTNFKSLAQIVKKQLEANARHDSKHKERKVLQQTDQDVSRSHVDKRVPEKTKTNCGNASVDYKITAQNSPRGQQNLKSSKRSKEEPYLEKEFENLKPCPIFSTVPFTETRPGKNQSRANAFVDYKITAQNSPRGQQNLKSSKRSEEKPYLEKGFENLKPCPIFSTVPFTETRPGKNQGKANMTGSSAKSPGIERREAEVDVRRENGPNVQLMFEQCFSMDKRAMRSERHTNSVPPELGLQATFRSADGIDVERTWSKIVTEAKICIEKHQAKFAEVREQLSDLEGEKARKKWVTTDEYERRLETRVPLKKKISELERQEQEFDKSMNRLKKEFDQMKFESRPKKNRVNFLRSQFSLELKRFETALPLYARKSDIVDTILANRVSIILGETGSGKSTQILQYLYDAGLSRDGIIVCTQPRKVAALSLARHVAQEMGCKLGNLVGYHVGSKYCHGPNTHLMYVTDNALLNDCLKDAMFTKYSCIVIDEAHERSIYTDLLLGFVKKALAVRKDLKVIITSATIDPEVFVRYLSSSGNFVPPVLEISGRAFPVDVCYEESTEDYVTAACDKALEVHWGEPPGDILVFLSSPIETERACKRFQIQVATEEAVIMELHGRLQVEDQQKVFEILPPEKRKVVFATNCAETSITIPGIKYVIDTGRVREVSYDPMKNMSSLQLTWVNKSSAEQRKGRAGRTDCGKCFRLYTEEQYKHDMRPVSVPEILRVHLGQALLKISSLGVSNPLEFEFIESPSFAAIENAMSVLRELGAYGNRGITDLGRKLAKIALEPRLGKAALLGVEQKIAYEALVTAVIASFGGNVFFRVGTEEQKQQADKRKTRFCDQWGDIVTLVNVYKEWEGVPKSRQGAWCVENSINGKSMKMAREMLREMLKTFKQDLKMTVRRKWSRRADLNCRLAKIIFHCYSSNLCRFSGHTRGGYCLARLPNVSLQLHPSSAFNYMEDFPKWVVYEQVFTTSRTFMQNTTFVDESWIREKIAEGRLEGSLFDGLQRCLLEPSIVCTVGATCMNRLLSGKAHELRWMESCLKNLFDEKGEKVLIDLLPTDGTVTVYTTKLFKESATREINARISVIRKSIQDECIEQPIRTGATVQLILEKGAKIRTILMPNDSRQVKVSKVTNEFSGDVEELLSVFGEIESVRRAEYKKDSQGQDQRDAWGFVTYKLPEAARRVIEDSAMLPFQLELQKPVLQMVNRIEDFKVRVQVVRRRQRDFGFVRFKDAFHATLALADVKSIRVEYRGLPRPANLLNDYAFPVPNCIYNVQLISVTPDKRNSQQMHMKRIPQWADKRIIWDALAKAVGPELVIEEVHIAREPPPAPVLSEAKFAEFCQAIRSKLWISGNLWEFQLHAVPPTEKAYNMTAYVAFSNAYHAQVARDLLNDCVIVGSKAVAAVELRTSIFVSGQIFRLFGGRIFSEMEAARSSSGGGLTIEMAERRNGSHSIQLEATSLDRLKEGKARIDGIINGLEVNLDLKRFSHLKSSDGKRFLELLQRETQAILRLDERRQAVYVHGRTKSAEDVKNRLCKYLYTDFPERVVDIQLRGSRFPNGLMKVLVVKYGSNLERLKDLSGATTVELFLRKHVIQVQGSDESVQRLKELVEGEAGRIPGRDAAAVKSSLPDCPVCLGPVERESSYIMEYCGHSYCKECALSLIDNGLENNEIPIQCAAEGCSQDVTIRDLRNLPVDINKVFDTAIRAFVQTNSTEFGYCITADCPMVYRKARENKNGELFQCSECQLRLCTACASEFHHGISCEVYRCLQGEDNDIKTWLTERPKDRSLCPQCKMGIEKNGGCMHVECTACRVHICWRCKSTFTASARCYDHLTKCGGIFGNENFVL